jgi:ParB-like chromosome segregation protein Spo0J
MLMSKLDGGPISIPLAEIDVGPRRRAIDEKKMQEFAESIAAVGLKTPITVRREDRRWKLVVGLHRLVAARRLGWHEIQAVIMVGSERDARLWEIAENLHRAELTVLERAEHVAEWIKLTEAEVSAQVAPKPQGGRPEGGIRAAARELGIERTDARRAITIASIMPEAKESARKAGMDDNQSRLLEIAAQPIEQQVKKVAEIVHRTSRPRKGIAAAKRERARRRAAKQGVQNSERNGHGEEEAAVRSMAVLILELPEPSIRSFVEKAETVPFARMEQLVSAMLALRPEQFEAEHDQAGDAGRRAPPLFERGGDDNRVMSAVPHPRKAEQSNGVNLTEAAPIRQESDDGS